MKTETLMDGTVSCLSPEEVAEGLEQGDILLIDVRTPQEFAYERIGGALLAPMQSLQTRHLPRDADQRVVLHCGSGMRSRKVAEMMLADGRSRAAHMEGGLAAWKKAGLAYTGTDPATGAPKQMSN